jgi:hypothetical protein
MFIVSLNVSTRQADRCRLYILRSGGTLTLTQLSPTLTTHAGDAVLNPNNPEDVTVNCELTVEKSTVEFSSLPSAFNV